MEKKVFVERQVEANGNHSEVKSYIASLFQESGIAHRRNSFKTEDRARTVNFIADLKARGYEEMFRNDFREEKGSSNITYARVSVSSSRRKRYISLVKISYYVTNYGATKTWMIETAYSTPFRKTWAKNYTDKTAWEGVAYFIV